MAADGKGAYLFAWVKGTLGRDRLTVSNQDVWVRGTDGRTLAVKWDDRKAAADPDADETHPVLVKGPAGEFLLVNERSKSGEPRRIAARLITVGE